MNVCNIAVENMLQKNWFYIGQKNAVSWRKVIQVIVRLWLLFTLAWEVLQSKNKLRCVCEWA